MANAEIVPIGLSELPIVVDLFNQVFRPGRELGFFHRRLTGRYNSLILLGLIERRPVGFAIGYEIKPSTFYDWLLGVLPDYRRAGIASQLMEGMSAWARDNDYRTIRFECFNHHRPMLHLAISQNFDAVGFRYDDDAGENLLILEQKIQEAQGG